MHGAGLTGVGHRRRRRRPPEPPPHDDLVGRRFVADPPDRLWCTDITEHPTAEGKVRSRQCLPSTWCAGAEASYHSGEGVAPGAFLGTGGEDGQGASAEFGVGQTLEHGVEFDRCF